MSSAPARIALRTGARLVPAVVIRDAADSCRFVPIVESGLHIEQSGNEEADVEAITQRLAHTFEGFVRSYPDQWFAFKPVWPVESRMAVRGPDFNDRLNHLALELANALFRDLPKPSAYLVARLAGDIAFYLRKNIREDVEDNMRHVLGPEASPVLVKACAQEVFRNVCRYYADLIRIPRTRPEELMRKEMRIIGFDKLKRKMAAGRGIVIATAHFGNPEVATQIGHLLGLNVLVLSEPLNPPAFSDLVHRLRESQGARFEEVGFKAIGKALAHLRAGGTVAVTCDRDIQGTGVPLRFFGTETLMPLGAAELAYRTDAVLAPAYCRRTRKGYDVVFEEPIESAKTGQRKLDAITTTKAMIERMEAWIRSGPGQWMVLERIWEDSGRLKEAREKPTLGSRTAVVDV
jgi:lauroyl/myristoyl acyltransferase